MTPRDFHVLLESGLHFTQIMGECDSKEWIAKIPGYDSDDWTGLWALIKLETGAEQYDENGEYDGEDTSFRVGVYTDSSDIDWLEEERQRSRSLELLVQQQFLCRRPEFTDVGTEPMTLMHAAYRYIADTY